MYFDNRIVCCNIDWESDEINNHHLLDFSSTFEKIYYIQPLNENYLVHGIRKSGDNDESHCTMVMDSTGVPIRKLALGYFNTNTCIVDSKDGIIAGYYPYGVYHCEDMNIKSGLIKYDYNGNKQWENKKYDIVDCYALDVDSSGNIWFSPDTNIVKIDTNENYHVYNKDYKFSRGFLFNRHQTRFVFEKGYPNNNHFVIKDFSHDQFTNERLCNFMFHDMIINVDGFAFRNSKAVIWDAAKLYWFDWGSSNES